MVRNPKLGLKTKVESVVLIQHLVVGQEHAFSYIAYGTSYGSIRVKTTGWLAQWLAILLFQFILLSPVLQHFDF